MSTLIAPKLVFSRHQARALTSSLASGLSGSVVMVDCMILQASTPSFVDELARRAAQNRGVGDRMETG